MEQTPDHDIIIVGSGFAGLGMAIRLQQEGREDFVVLEQAQSVGGTWRDNIYPGCACDVPSHMYSYSFAQNPDWTSVFSPQPEIRTYLERVTDRFGVRPKIRFGAKMTRAAWDEGAQQWSVEVNGEQTLTCRVLVAGLGPLNRPAYPKVEGLDAFAGRQFHSMEWDSDCDLTGKRVAVIGTGASAIQFVPEVVKDAAHVDVFQRTPPWVMPRPEHDYSARAKRLFRRLPALQRLYRASIYWRLEARVPLFDHPQAFRVAELVAKANIAKQIPDDQELRAKVTPGYRIGCKRILMSNTYYRALAEDHVDVFTQGLAEVTPAGVVTDDGVEHPADVIIYGTGFRITDNYTPLSIIGRDGLDINDFWTQTGGVEAYRGVTVTGFPNLFMLVGPNTGLGHNSIVYMVEAQVDYVLDALRLMDERGLGALTVREQVQHAYNAGLQKRLEGTVWQAGGCKSWYVDADGNNRTLWPGHTYTFKHELEHFDLDNYETEPVAERVLAGQEA
jgi:cation diffusion facilitator CzcD-associated flavoprotein CzcO